MSKNNRVLVKTPLGALSCEPYEDKYFPGLTVYWEGRQIAVIEPSSGTKMMRILIWDTDKEDPSTIAPVFPGYGE